MANSENSKTVIAEDKREVQERFGEGLIFERKDELSEKVNTPNRRRNNFKRVEDIRDEAMNDLGNMGKRLQIMIITESNALSDAETLAEEFESRGIKLSKDLAA